MENLLFIITSLHHHVMPFVAWVLFTIAAILTAGLLVSVAIVSNRYFHGEDVDLSPIANVRYTIWSFLMVVVCATIFAVYLGAWYVFAYAIMLGAEWYLTNEVKELSCSN